MLRLDRTDATLRAGSTPMPTDRNRSGGLLLFQGPRGLMGRALSPGWPARVPGFSGPGAPRPHAPLSSVWARARGHFSHAEVTARGQDMGQVHRPRRHRTLPRSPTTQTRVRERPLSGDRSRGPRRRTRDRGRRPAIRASQRHPRGLARALVVLVVQDIDPRRPPVGRPRSGTHVRIVPSATPRRLSW